MLVLGILNGILVTVGLTFADLLGRIARPHHAVLGLVDGVPGMHDVVDYPNAQVVPRLSVDRSFG